MIITAQITQISYSSDFLKNLQKWTSTPFKTMCFQLLLFLQGFTNHANIVDQIRWKYYRI